MSVKYLKMYTLSEKKRKANLQVQHVWHWVTHGAAVAQGVELLSLENKGFPEGPQFDPTKS